MCLIKLLFSPHLNECSLTGISYPAQLKYFKVNLFEKLIMTLCRK